MGLFGIKKANEDSRPSNTFINENVINAADYSNMPNNTVIGYGQPTEVSNTENFNQGETFVYSQVSNNDFNNQFMSVDNVQNVYDSNQVNVEQTNIEQPMVEQEMPVNDVVVTVDSNLGSIDGFSTVSEFNAVEENASFDNSALFELPAGAIAEETKPEVEEVVVESEILEDEPEIILDPLNNANNPIPVNPVATPEVPKVEEEVEEEIPLFDEEEEIKTNLFTVVNMMIGVVIKPGTTISTNARRYKKIFDALSITFWVTILSFVLCLAGRLVVGCFSRTENAISGASKIVLDFSRLVDTNNYIPYLLITLFIGIVTILIVAIIYYLSSFIFSKGIHIGTYFAISTLAVVPVIIGFTILYPVISILSSGVAAMALIFSIIYALIILFTGINEVLKFKNNDQRIIYNAINMAVVFSIMLFIFKTLSYLNILDISMLM